MTIHRFLPAASVFLFALGSMAFGRLGENEAQSKVRYGDPVEGLVTPGEKPLLEGAKEAVYNFDGWRVRVAFVNGVTHRIQYVKIPPQGQQPPKLTEAELNALLDAEKGAGKWREQKARTGVQALNDLKQALEGRAWERNDHADAHLLFNIVLQFQSRDAEKLEKQLAKGSPTAPKGGTPAPNLPKF